MGAFEIGALWVMFIMCASPFIAGFFYLVWEIILLIWNTIQYWRGKYD